MILISLAAGAAVPAVIQLTGTDILSLFSVFPLPLIIVPFLLYLLIYAVDALRLRIVLRHFGYRLPFADRYVNGVIGSFYSNITPMAAGGQPAQILHLVRCNIPGSEATAIILVRFIEYLVLSLMITVYGIFRFRRQLQTMISSGSTGAGIVTAGLILYFFISSAMLFLFLVPWVGNRLSGVLGRSGYPRIAALGDKLLLFSAALEKFKRNGLKVIAADFLLGLLYLVIQAFSLWVLLRSRTVIPGGFPAVLTSFVLLNTIAYFVPSPGGSGGIEGVYTVFFSFLAGINTAAAVLAWRFGSYYLQLGFQIVISFFSVWRKNNENSNVELILLPAQGRNRKVC